MAFRKFDDFRVRLEELSKTILYMMRLEIRIHCIYYIELAYREVLEYFFLSRGHMTKILIEQIVILKSFLPISSGFINAYPKI
jgi:hypothetical protein